MDPALVYSNAAGFVHVTGREEGREGGRNGGREAEMEAASQRSGQDRLIQHVLTPSSLPPSIVTQTGVDLERKKFRFLAPCPGALPSRYLVVGSVVWVEEGT